MSAGQNRTAQVYLPTTCSICQTVCVSVEYTQLARQYSSRLSTNNLAAKEKKKKRFPVVGGRRRTLLADKRPMSARENDGEWRCHAGDGSPEVLLSLVLL